MSVHSKGTVKLCVLIWKQISVKSLSDVSAIFTASSKKIKLNFVICWHFFKIIMETSILEIFSNVALLPIPVVTLDYTKSYIPGHNISCILYIQIQFTRFSTNSVWILTIIWVKLVAGRLGGGFTLPARGTFQSRASSATELVLTSSPPPFFIFQFFGAQFS